MMVGTLGLHALTQINGQSVDTPRGRHRNALACGALELLTDASRLSNATERWVAKLFGPT